MKELFLLAVAFLFLVCFILLKTLILMNHKARVWIDFLGRLCLASTFAVAIPPKFLRFSLFVDSIVSKGIPESIASLLLVLAIFLLVFGVGFLLFKSNVRVGASLLLLFLLPTTLIMHISPFQSLEVFMNLGLIGGLLILISRDKISFKASNNNILDQFFNVLVKLIRKILPKN